MGRDDACQTLHGAVRPRLQKVHPKERERKVLGRYCDEAVEVHTEEFDVRAVRIYGERRPANVKAKHGTVGYAWSASALLFSTKITAYGVSGENCAHRCVSASKSALKKITLPSG